LRAGTPEKDVEELIDQMADRCQPPYPSDANDPLVKDVVESALRVRTEGRDYTNAALARWFNVSDLEANSLELESIVPCEVAKARTAPPGGQRALTASRRQAIILQRRLDCGYVESTSQYRKLLESHGITSNRETINRDLAALNLTSEPRPRAGRPSKI
jgi:hypothetical protein